MAHRIARLFVTVSTLVATFGAFGASTAAAADAPPRYRWLGLQADVGVPDGAGIGAVVRPGITWARLEASYTYSMVASGVRGGITIDPLATIVAPTLTIEGGAAFDGELPASWLHLSGNARVNYQYANVHLGLELGRRDSWRIFIRGGATGVRAEAADLHSATGAMSASADRLDVNATVLGTAKVGFVVLF